MPCFAPQSFRRKIGGGVTTNASRSWSDLPNLLLPCGGCIGCRMARAQDWSTRLYHEAQLHERSSFITLTYSDEWLPADYSVSVRELQLFMKRVRKARGKGIRFLACGEYGDTNLRPHYHLLMFGEDWAHDRKHWSNSPSGHPLYRSESLEKLWTKGFSDFGSVTPESANYVARYVLKKVNGKKADDHYTRVHPLTGEVHRVKPEFLTMSLGIGGEWFSRFKSDAFPSDFVVVDGQKRPIPRYYKKKLQASAEHSTQDRDMALRLSNERSLHAASRASDNTPERLDTRRELQERRVNLLKRDL